MHQRFAAADATYLPSSLRTFQPRNSWRLPFPSFLLVYIILSNLSVQGRLTYVSSMTSEFLSAAHVDTSPSRKKMINCDDIIGSTFQICHLGRLSFFSLSSRSGWMCSTGLLHNSCTSDSRELLCSQSWVVASGLIKRHCKLLSVL